MTNYSDLIEIGAGRDIHTGCVAESVIFIYPIF